MGIKSKRDKFQIGALLLPGVMVFALFTIYPITKLFYMSFFEWNFGTMLEHPFCGIKNYIDVLSDETFCLWLAETCYLWRQFLEYCIDGSNGHK